MGPGKPCPLREDKGKLDIFFDFYPFLSRGRRWDMGDQGGGSREALPPRGRLGKRQGKFSSFSPNFLCSWGSQWDMGDRDIGSRKALLPGGRTGGIGSIFFFYKFI